MDNLKTALKSILSDSTLITYNKADNSLELNSGHARYVIAQDNDITAMVSSRGSLWFVETTEPVIVAEKLSRYIMKGIE